MTFAQFSKRAGLMASTLYRLENGQQSLTLKKLRSVLRLLKCSLADVIRIKRPSEE